MSVNKMGIGQGALSWGKLSVWVSAIAYSALVWAVVATSAGVLHWDARELTETVLSLNS